MVYNYPTTSRRLVEQLQWHAAKTIRRRVTFQFVRSNGVWDTHNCRFLLVFALEKDEDSVAGRSICWKDVFNHQVSHPIRGGLGHSFESR
jgi:hypothetical protein